MHKKLLVFFLVALQLSSAFANWGLLSVFDPGNGNNQGRVTAMDNWQGKTNALQLVFTTYDQADQSWLWSQLVLIWNSQHVPIISWEPWFTQSSTPGNIAALIAAGQYDSYIQNWGSNLFSFIAGPDGKMNTADDRRAFIRFAHEFNGNWYPWSASGSSTTQDYINMWRHVQSAIVNLGVDRKHVQWIWSSICCEPDGVSPMENYFVGNDYIDWIGIGGFNFGTTTSWSAWYSASQQFTAMVGRMRTVTGGLKPLGITEVSTVSQGGDKDAWLLGMFSFAEQNNIRMISYFNLDKNEVGGVKDWAIFGGQSGDETASYNGASYAAYSGYRQGAASSYWKSSDPTLTTLVSDNLFYGIGTCAQNSDCLTGYSCSSGTCVVTGTQASASPSQSQAPASATPSQSKAPASDSPTPTPSKAASSSSTPSQSKAPASATPSSSKAPASTTPSQSQAPASATPSSSKAPASATPSSSKAPASATPSSSKAPASATPSTSKAPASTTPSTSKAPASATPTPSKAAPSATPSTSAKPATSALYIYKTGVRNFFSRTVGAGTNVVIDATGNAPEGTTMITVKTMGAGGFGLYYPTSNLDISDYTTLNFYLASSVTTQVALQDSNGNAHSVSVSRNNMSWQLISIKLKKYSKNGVNLASINGEFLISANTAGRFQIDNIYFA